MKYAQQTKQRFALLATQIATVKKFYKSKESVYLTLLTFILLFSPYIHLTYYGDSDIKGNFFGFPWMSSFLYALALPMTLISAGLLLSYFGQKYKENFLRLIGFLVNISGCFYLAWTFYTTPDDFAIGTYLSVLILITLGFFVLTNFIKHMVIIAEERLKLKIQILVGFILAQRPLAKDPMNYEVKMYEVFRSIT